MEMLVPFLLLIGSFGLIFLVYRWFVTKRYPNKTSRMLDAIPELEQIGLHRTNQGYAGYYRKYYVNIYATTSLKVAGYMSGSNFQVWVSIAPEPDQLKGLGGFFGKYMVLNQQADYAMIGFVLKYIPGLNSEEAIQNKLQRLVDALIEKGVKPYVIKN